MEISFFLIRIFWLPYSEITEYILTADFILLADFPFDQRLFYLAKPNWKKFYFISFQNIGIAAWTLSV